jgi:glycosyltransferase involved in cell wall biosynthesis
LNVNIFGYIRGQFGLAESARLYARALIHSGANVSLIDVDLGLPHSWNDRSLERWIADRAPHPVSMIFVNPDYLEAALRQIGESRLTGRYLVGCWFWELERLPRDWVMALDHVDAVMVASEFVEHAVRRMTDKPVFRVPMPVDGVPDSGLERSDFGLEDGKFIFLASFDFNSWIARKNPMAVLQAFSEAFPAERDDVRLLIKSSNGFRHPDKFRHLLNLAAGDSRIVVRDDIMPRRHLSALQRCCDAYVSLHRSEGFGLGLAECMLLGKPVIATGWSGNMEFMNDQNSCLVGYHLVDVGAQDYPGGEGQRWAEPDTAQAASWMRRLVDDPAFARSIGSAARSSVSLALAPSRAAETVRRNLSDLCNLAHERQELGSRQRSALL